jgi:hypothetical protein
VDNTCGLCRWIINLRGVFSGGHGLADNSTGHNGTSICPAVCFGSFDLDHQYHARSHDNSAWARRATTWLSNRDSGREWNLNGDSEIRFSICVFEPKLSTMAANHV